jgi:hypothetical protein
MILKELFDMWYTPYSMLHYAVGILVMYSGLPWYTLIFGYALREILFFTDNLVSERIMNYVMATFGFFVSYISYKYGWFTYVKMLMNNISI